MKKSLVWLLLALMWTGFIWSNSLQPPEESSQTSGRAEELVKPLLTDVGVPQEAHSFVVRKTAHMTEFAILGMLWLLFIRRPGGLLSCVWSLGLCAVTAVLDESIQHFVPGRSCELRDMTIDTLGAAAGIFLLTALRPLLRKRRKN